MEKIKKKLDYLDETLKLLGLSEAEVVNLWKQVGRVDCSPKITNGGLSSADGYVPLCKAYRAQIKEGMFWYEDDTVSFEFTETKRIKAIIELIEGYVVYGDLTASRLLDIKERKLSWNDARKYIKNFSYPCRSNEKIVWYTGKQLQDVYLYYRAVGLALAVCGARKRRGEQWSSTEWNASLSRGVNFDDGDCPLYYKTDKGVWVRPVLEFELQ